MTPMFVETQSSQGPESVVSASPSETMKGKLRATQTSLEFSQTQAPGGKTNKNNLKYSVFSVLCLDFKVVTSSYVFC